MRTTALHCIDGGGPLTRYTLRLTHVYRREAGEWKVVHEHSKWEPSDQSSHPSQRMPPRVGARALSPTTSAEGGYCEPRVAGAWATD